MRARSTVSSAILLGCLCTVALVAGCSDDAPTALTNDAITPALTATDRVSVCHRSGSSGAIIAVVPSAVANHLQHGDYVTDLSVSHAGSQPTDATHFRRIGDALAAARAVRLDRGELQSAACRITIAVAAGTFLGSGTESSEQDVELFPLNVDVPDITLLGAFVMQADPSGRATGLGATGRRTTLQPAQGVSDLNTIILANGHPGGSAGHGLVVEGFVMKGVARHAMFAVRVRRLVIRGNRVEAGFGVTLDFRLTSAAIVRNQIGGSFTCDMCLAGPGVYHVTGNRLLAGAVQGIVTVPTLDPLFAAPLGVEPSALPATADVSADITNNEVRDHRNFPGGVGVRLAAMGPGAPDTRNTTHVRLHHNRLVNNTFGVMVDGAVLIPDTRLRSDVNLVLGGNTIERSCQADLYVTFEPHSGVPEPGALFLRNSTFDLTLGGDVRFRDAWFSNPAGFGNSLIVDGRRIGNGTRQPFDELTCPARRG